MSLLGVFMMKFLCFWLLLLYRCYNVRDFKVHQERAILVLFGLLFFIIVWKDFLCTEVKKGHFCEETNAVILADWNVKFLEVLSNTPTQELWGVWHSTIEGLWSVFERCGTFFITTATKRECCQLGWKSCFGWGRYTGSHAIPPTPKNALLLC